MAGDALSFQLDLSVTRRAMAWRMYANEPVEVRHHIENAEDGTRFTRSTGRPHRCSPRFRLRSRAPVFAGYVGLEEAEGR